MAQAFFVEESQPTMVASSSVVSEPFLVNGDVKLDIRALKPWYDDQRNNTSNSVKIATPSSPEAKQNLTSFSETADNVSALDLSMPTCSAKMRDDTIDSSAEKFDKQTSFLSVDTPRLSLPISNQAQQPQPSIPVESSLFSASEPPTPAPILLSDRTKFSTATSIDSSPSETLKSHGHSFMTFSHAPGSAAQQRWYRFSEVHIDEDMVGSPSACVPSPLFETQNSRQRQRLRTFIRKDWSSSDKGHLRRYLEAKLRTVTWQKVLDKRRFLLKDNSNYFVSLEKDGANPAEDNATFSSTKPSTFEQDDFTLSPEDSTVLIPQKEQLERLSKEHHLKEGPGGDVGSLFHGKLNEKRRLGRQQSQASADSCNRKLEEEKAPVGLVQSETAEAEALVEETHPTLLSTKTGEERDVRRSESTTKLIDYIYGIGEVFSDYSDEEVDHSSAPTSATAAPSLFDGTKFAEVVQEQIVTKTVLEQGVLTFNVSPTEGIQYLIDKNILKKDAMSVAVFLHLADGIDKRKIGDYIGKNNEFNMAVLKNYCHLFDFSGLKFHEAFRYFNSRFYLRTETEATARLLEAFSESYVKDNPSSPLNSDGVLSLMHAFLMLNGMYHNSKMKPKDRFTKQEFFERLSETEVKLDKALVDEMYDDIFKMPFRPSFSTSEQIYGRLARNPLMAHTYRSDICPHVDLDLLKSGGDFIKYGRKGRSHVRHVWLTDDAEYLCWMPKGEREFLYGSVDKEISTALPNNEASKPMNETHLSFVHPPEVDQQSLSFDSLATPAKNVVKSSASPAIIFSEDINEGMEAMIGDASTMLVSSTMDNSAIPFANSPPLIASRSHDVSPASLSSFKMDDNTKDTPLNHSTSLADFHPPTSSNEVPSVEGLPSLLEHRTPSHSYDNLKNFSVLTSTSFPQGKKVDQKDLATRNEDAKVINKAISSIVFAEETEEDKKLGENVGASQGDLGQQSSISYSDDMDDLDASLLRKIRYFEAADMERSETETRQRSSTLKKMKRNPLTPRRLHSVQNPVKWMESESEFVASPLSLSMQLPGNIPVLHSTTRNNNEVAAQIKNSTRVIGTDKIAVMVSSKESYQFSGTQQQSPFQVNHKKYFSVEGPKVPGDTLAHLHSSTVPFGCFCMRNKPAFMLREELKHPVPHRKQKKYYLNWRVRLFQGIKFTSQTILLRLRRRLKRIGRNRNEDNDANQLESKKTLKYVRFIPLRELRDIKLGYNTSKVFRRYQIAPEHDSRCLSLVTINRTLDLFGPEDLFPPFQMWTTFFHSILQKNLQAGYQKTSKRLIADRIVRISEEYSLIKHWRTTIFPKWKIHWYNADSAYMPETNVLRLPCHSHLSRGRFFAVSNLLVQFWNKGIPECCRGTLWAMAVGNVEKCSVSTFETISNYRRQLQNWIVSSRISEENAAFVKSLPFSEETNKIEREGSEFSLQNLVHRYFKDHRSCVSYLEQLNSVRDDLQASFPKLHSVPAGNALVEVYGIEFLHDMDKPVLSAVDQSTLVERIDLNFILKPWIGSSSSSSALPTEDVKGEDMKNRTQSSTLAGAISSPNLEVPQATHLVSNGSNTITPSPKLKKKLTANNFSAHASTSNTTKNENIPSAVFATKVEKLVGDELRALSTIIPDVTYSIFYVNAKETIRDAVDAILGNYILLKPENGYVYGMTKIASILAYHMKPPLAFLVFVNLVNYGILRDLYRFDDLARRNMKKRVAFFMKLFHCRLPDLANYFEALGVTAQTFFIPWILTLFAECLPLSTVSRLWDYLFLYGEVYTYKVALAVLLYHTHALQSSTFDGCIKLLHSHPDPGMFDNDLFFACLENCPVSLDEVKVLTDTLEYPNNKNANSA